MLHVKTHVFFLQLVRLVLFAADCCHHCYYCCSSSCMSSSSSSSLLLLILVLHCPCPHLHCPLHCPPPPLLPSAHRPPLTSLPLPLPLSPLPNLYFLLHILSFSSLPSLSHSLASSYNSLSLTNPPSKPHTSV